MAWAEQEEQKAQVPWLMGNLEEMTVPAFSSQEGISDNEVAINH